MGRGGSRIFYRKGCTRLLLYFNTNKRHSFFFCRIPVALENRRSSQGGAHPLHPPPRCAPDGTIRISVSYYILCLRRRTLILLSRNSIFLCKLSSSYTFGVLNSQPGLTNKLTSLQSTIISSLSLVSPISGERLSWLYLNSKLKKLVLMT